MPAFSVVIPAYNAGQFLPECLDSVAAQTFTDWEIIVVDDGSKDETAAAATRWAQRHAGRKLTLIRQENRGIGGARNSGVRAAAGELLAFLDADDLWLPAKLERVTHYLTRHPEVDLVCHDERSVGAGEAPRVLHHGPYTSYQDLLFRGNSVSTSATVVRRQRVLAIGGFSENVSFNGAEDYELWLRLARDGCRFAYAQEVLGIYRVHDGGITGQAEIHCRHHLNVLDAHFRQLGAAGPGQRYRCRRRRAAMLRGAVLTLMRQGRHGRAERLLLRAAREDPVALKTWALLLLNAVRARPR